MDLWRCGFSLADWPLVIGAKSASDEGQGTSEDVSGGRAGGRTDARGGGCMAHALIDNVEVYTMYSGRKEHCMYKKRVLQY